MRRRLIVTDLTRFSTNEFVCLAAIDPENGECIRPMPYLTDVERVRLRIAPGSIITGDFEPSRKRSGPHQEDYWRKNLECKGACGSEEFRKILERSSWPSIEAGFEITLQNEGRVLPTDHAVSRSIITIKVSPKKTQIAVDWRKPAKIKLHLQDGSGRVFRFLPITDLGFFDYALQHHAKDDLKSLNRKLRSQEEMFVRIGLSRDHTAPDGRRGYWLQANGIYTFPEFCWSIRLE